MQTVIVEDDLVLREGSMAATGVAPVAVAKCGTSGCYCGDSGGNNSASLVYTDDQYERDYAASLWMIVCA